MSDRTLGILSRCYIALAFGFIFTPIITLVIFAFNQNRFPSLPWQGFSLAWFQAVLNDQAFLAATRRSVIVALCVAVLATLLGALGAYFVTRWDFRGKGLYLGIHPGSSLHSPAYSGPCAPDLPAAVADCQLPDQGDHQPRRYRCALCLRHRASAPGELDPHLEQAAGTWAQPSGTLSAPWSCPALPALAAAFLLAMTVSWDEFIVAWFVSGLEITLPVYIWTSFQAEIQHRCQRHRRDGLCRLDHPGGAG
ncbi:MAG: hypothetical protein R2853_15005 [Thermomicrobiales bacterium]